MFDGKWQLTGRAYECKGVDVFGVGGGIQTGQGPAHRHPHQVEPFLPHPQLAHNLQQKQCGQWNWCTFYQIKSQTFYIITWYVQHF